MNEVESLPARTHLLRQPAAFTHLLTPPHSHLIDAEPPQIYERPTLDQTGSGSVLDDLQRLTKSTRYNALQQEGADGTTTITTSRTKQGRSATSGDKSHLAPDALFKIIQDIQATLSHTKRTETNETETKSIGGLGSIGDAPRRD